MTEVFVLVAVREKFLIFEKVSILKRTDSARNTYRITTY